MPVQAVQRAREVWFWVLLLGRWIMLNSPAWPNQLFGGLGCAIFVAFAFGSLGKLQAMGMEFVAWRRAAGRFFAFAAATGGGAGLLVVWFASAVNQRIAVAT